MVVLTLAYLAFTKRIPASYVHKPCVFVYRADSPINSSIFFAIYKYSSPANPPPSLGKILGISPTVTHHLFVKGVPAGIDVFHVMLQTLNIAILDCTLDESLPEPIDLLQF